MKVDRLGAAVVCLACCRTLQGFPLSSPPKFGRHVGIATPTPTTTLQLSHKPPPEDTPTEETEQVPKEKENDRGVTLEEMDWETAEIERQRSQRVWLNLMWPYEVSRYVTSGLWIFLGVGYLLNVFGFAYVWQDGHLAIGTVAQQQFQAELMRGLRESAAQTRSH